MDEHEFTAVADAMLARIEAALEKAQQTLDFDFELKPGGVIEIECEDGSKIIVNRHGAAREIWVAAKSGGFHFRRDGERWMSARDGAELMALLSQVLSAQTGEPVTLA